MTFVRLNIYKFYILDLIPEYHAEIIAYGKSFSYSDEGLEISMVMNKHGLDGYQLVKRISLGFSGLSENAFMEEFFLSWWKIIRLINIDYLRIIVDISQSK